MHPFVIVVLQIFLQGAIDRPHIVRKVVEALLLERPIEPLHVRVVVALSHAGMAVRELSACESTTSQQSCEVCCSYTNPSNNVGWPW